MAFDNQTVYNKFQKQNCGHHDHPHGCGCESKKDDCGCCPPGLVAVEDGEGKVIACLTPTDAIEYGIKKIDTVICSEGFVKLFDKSTDPPTFVACVSQDQFAELNDALNGEHEVPPTNLAVVPNSGNDILADETTQLYAIFTPLNTTNQAVTWSSTNAAAASVSPGGLVTGIGPGVTTVRATSDEDPSVFGETTVTVS